MCFTAISVSLGYRNTNRTQSSVRYCQISAPISVRTSVALPNADTSFDDGEPKISAGFGAFMSGSTFVVVGTRAVWIG